MAGCTEAEMVCLSLASAKHANTKNWIILGAWCSPEAFLICFAAENIHVSQGNLSFDSFLFYSKPSTFLKGLGKANPNI